MVIQKIFKRLWTLFVVVLSASSVVSAEVKCVCFDVGDVLIKLHSWPDSFRRAGVKCPLKVNKELIRKALGKVRLYNTGECSEAEFLNYAAKTLHVKADQFKSVLVAFIGPEFSGVKKLVNDLQKEGYYTGCISNTIPVQWNVSANKSKYPGLNLLQTKITSFGAKLRKPDLAIYQLFEKETGYMADQIVFFDDLEVNVDAARKLGWRAYQINSKLNTVKQMKEKLKECGVKGIE